MSGSGGVRIEGAFEGEIALRGLLVVGETGRVTCDNVRANAVIVAGAVRGNITTQKLEIRASGRVWGDVITTAFVTDEGAFLRGQIRMEETVEHGLESTEPAPSPGPNPTPVVAIVGIDLEFYEKLGKLFPHNAEARSWYAGKPEKILNVATLNGALEGGYMILAARSLGLDCGPMSGFNKEKLEKEFFPDGKGKSLFICALGYGERSKLHPRGPRLEFEEACTIV